MRRLLMVAAIAFVLAAGGTFAQEMKVGVFEFGRVSQETNEGLRVQKHLRDFQEQKQAELGQKEKELKDLQDQLAAQALALSPEKRSSMEKVIQKKQNELDTAREGAQRDWQIEFNEAQTAFQQKVVDTVQALGKEAHYLVILERDQCVFRSDAVDVTPLVIERLNKMTPPPPAAGSPAPSATPPAGTPPAPSGPKPPAPPG